MLKIEPPFINDLYIEHRHVHQDERGTFNRFFAADELSAAGRPSGAVHINSSTSTSMGTLRGIHFQYRKNNLLFFGEGALSSRSATAFITGIIGNISDHLETTVAIRDYGKEYHSFHANGFGESDQTRNEHGIYWGAKK